MHRSLKAHKPNLVAIWLLAGVFMIIIQIVLGGITRLTGSGLSITEWKPILGVVPPLTEQEWNLSFHKYQQIAQFKKLNSHFTIADFKFIYFWEWLHRLWGRVIGIVFLIPFLLFLIKGYFTKKMAVPLFVLFLLGGLQGIIGWLMVSSGLNDSDLYVSHIRLSIHFIAAVILLIYTVGLAVDFLMIQKISSDNNFVKSWAIVILALLILQLGFGGLMAGLKAGVYAPTWPDINGEFIPQGWKIYSGDLRQTISEIINNPFAVHFVHRNLAYLLAVLITVWTYAAVRTHNSRPRYKMLSWSPFCLTVIQIILGIYSTLTSFRAIPQGWGHFEWFALSHQFIAILLILSLTLNLYVATKSRIISV